MNNITTIKERLGKIQKHFNPEKSTYKVLEHVINDDLTSFGMLMELSKIRGVSKYPDDIKTEYISIINDLKEIITEERKIEHQRRQEESTKELKDLITRLEKRKDLHPERNIDNFENFGTEVRNVSLENNTINKEFTEQVPEVDVAKAKVETNAITVKTTERVSNLNNGSKRIVKKSKNNDLNIILLAMLLVLLIIIILLLICY